jgi:hypothetical protein
MVPHGTANLIFFQYDRLLVAPKARNMAAICQTPHGEICFAEVCENSFAGRQTEIEPTISVLVIHYSKADTFLELCRFPPLKACAPEDSSRSCANASKGISNED